MRAFGAFSRRFLTDEAGFSLVEVLISAAVFVVVFVMLASLVAQATSGFSGTRVLTATLIAQNAMQELLSTPESQSQIWVIESNGINWEVDQSIEETTEFTREAKISVRRVSDGKEYATLWTKFYQTASR